MNIVVETDEERYEITLEVSPSSKLTQDVKVSWHSVDSDIMLGILELHSGEIAIIKDKRKDLRYNRIKLRTWSDLSI